MNFDSIDILSELEIEEEYENHQFLARCPWRIYCDTGRYDTSYSYGNCSSYCFTASNTYDSACGVACGSGHSCIYITCTR